MNNKSTASKALSLARYVSRKVDGELKRVDSALSVQPPVAGLVTLISGMARGDDFNQRIGLKTEIKSFLIRWRAVLHANASATGIRVALVQDKQVNGVLPGTNDIYGGALLSPVSHQRTQRFIVLWDKFIQLNDNSGKERYGKKYRKLNIKASYAGAGSAIGNIMTNALYLVTFSDEAVNFPVFDFETRLTMIDN